MSNGRMSVMACVFVGDKERRRKEEREVGGREREGGRKKRQTQRERDTNIYREGVF